MIEKSLTKQRFDALEHVLKVITKSSAKSVVYGTAILGTASLIPGISLPSELSMIAGGIGIETLGSILDRVAQGNLTNKKIIDEVNYVFSGKEIDTLITKDEFDHTLSRLLENQSKISKQNQYIFRKIQKLENILFDLLNDRNSEFETEVEELLTLSGYVVRRNEVLNGIDLGITARKGDFLDNLCLVVVCEDKKDVIGIKLVQEKFSLLAGINDASIIYKMVIVTRFGYTPQAKTFANSVANLELLTAHEIEKNLINFEPYFQWYVNNYENSLGIFKEGLLYQHYVELCAKDDLDNLIPSVTNEVVDWLHDDQNHLLFILGEYGSGKTSFCRQMVYSLINEKRRRNIGGKYIPILINLRDYRNAFNIKQVITDTLVNQYGVNLPSFLAFERICSKGRVLLFLDGFDEMADKSDKSTLIDCFSQIFILASLNTKIILTSRSNFFKSHVDVIELLKRFSINIPYYENENQLIAQLTFSHQGRVMYIQNLNRKQILQFIEKRFGLEAKSILQKIEGIHDLSDLSTRPVLLDMILSTLPKLMEMNQRVNSAALYEYYTNRWSARDDWRVDLPLHIRQTFCEVLGFTLYRSDIQEMSYNLLHDVMTQALLGISKSDEQLEKFQNDLQTCSFLVRVGKQDTFRFAHKSFMEFFVARKLINDLAEGKYIEDPKIDPEKYIFDNQEIVNDDPYWEILSSSRLSERYELSQHK